MLTLLRNIRKSLIDSGSTQKYLLYAVGEIALVVVGILIALQINNWNEEEKDRKKEVSYLISLKSNLENDINLLEEIILQDSMDILSLRNITNQILSANGEKPIQRNNALFRAQKFHPNKSTIDNIISSGNMDIIQNDSLVDKLLIYYRTVDVYHDGIDYSLKNYSRDLESLFIKFDHVLDHPLLKRRPSRDFREDPSILNAIYFKNGLLRYQIQNYKALQSRAENILKMLELNLS